MNKGNAGTPLANRLRGKARKNQSDNQLGNPGHKPENMKETEAASENMLQKNSLLLQHIEDLQRQTEKTLIDSMTETMEKNKIETNTNIAGLISSLTTSVNEIKFSLKGVEESVHKELQEIRTCVRSVDAKVDETIEEVRRVEKMAKAENSRTENKLKGMIDDNIETTKKLSSAISNVSADLRKAACETDKKLIEQDDKLKKFMKNMEDEMDRVKMRAYGNSNELRMHTSQIESLDIQARSQNLVVDGLAEKTDAETRNELGEIITKIIPNFDITTIRKVRRLGKLVKKRKKPRQVLVLLSDGGVRDLLISKATEIRNSTNNTDFWINRDQSDSNKRRHGLVKACYKLLLANKFAASMKGSIITYDGKQFGYDSLNLLPDPCRPFHVKTCETDDGRGLCFASEHVFCSNFAQAKIRYRDQLFTSVEHAYQITKVKDAGYTELAAEMQGITNPYYLKKLGGEIPTSKKWKQQQEQIMEELIREKFTQNPRLRELLKYDDHDNYYEMTVDRLWATGIKLKHGVKTVDRKSLKGVNRVEVILTQIKSELVQGTNLDPRRRANSPTPDTVKPAESAEGATEETSPKTVSTA